jgi:hypothetical protein
MVQVSKGKQMLICPALIYSVDSPLLPVPFIIHLDNDKLEVNEAGELDTSKFFKDVFLEHVYVEDWAKVVIRRDVHCDFVVSAQPSDTTPRWTEGDLSPKSPVVMVVNLPDGVAPSDVGIVYDE